MPDEIEELEELRASNHSLVLQVEELESERNNYMHREHEAQEQMRFCHKILDRIGAPRNQDNGLSYHLNGRLSRLIRNETGKIWEAELREAETERDRYRDEVVNLLKSASPHPEHHPSMHRAWVRATATLGELGHPVTPNYLK